MPRGNMNKPIWLSTDELTESVNALGAFISNLRRVKRDRYYWKWAIVALHNSAQGFMVCALRGTSNLAVLSPKAAKEWKEAYEQHKPDPREELDGFLNLYKKIKGNYMIQYIHSQKFVPRGQQGANIKKLNSFRNDFIHFVPKGWSIEVTGFPKICEDVISIIDFLVTRSGNVRFYFRKNVEDKCLDLLTKSKQLLRELKRAYGG